MYVPMVYRMQLHTRRMKNGGRIKIDMLTLQCLLKTLVMRCTRVQKYLGKDYFCPSQRRSVRNCRTLIPVPYIDTVLVRHFFGV